MARALGIFARLLPLAVALSPWEARAGFHWTLNADGTLVTTGYADSVAQTNQFLETARLSLPVTVREGSAFRLKLDPLLQADPLNDSPSERYWIDLPEGYAQWQSHGWTIRAGYDTFTWGVTDGFNPLDVVSARRYQDALVPDKLGAPALSVRKSLGPLTWEGIYIPWQRSGILPGESSRWLPRRILTTRTSELGNEPVTVLLPSDPNYSYAGAEELDHALENAVGTRLEGQNILPGLDASLEVYEGAAPTPVVDTLVYGNATEVYPAIVIRAAPGIQLTPVEYRELVYGGTLVYAGLGMIFRFETAITRMVSQRADLPGNAEQYILAAEHTFPLGPQGFTVLGQIALSQHALPADNTTVSIDRIFDRAAMLGLRYAFSEKLGITAYGLYDTEFHTELAEGEATYSLSDPLKLKLTGLGIWGAPDTPLGAYSENDCVQVTLQFAL